MKTWIAFAAVAFLTVFMSARAPAVETRRWEFDGFDEWSRGDAFGVEIGSSGRLGRSLPVDFENVSADGVWSLARDRGTVYLGTGNGGKLLAYKNGSIRELAATSQVAVTAIRIDPRGSIYFAAIPGGIIHRIGKDGQLDKFAETGEDYVWDFILDGSDVIAATGPDGKVLVISSSGSVKKTIETGEKNIMCLFKAPDGKLYAGTSDDGLVLEINGSDFRVVHDFDEKEVKRLAWAGGKDGMLLAAVNQEAGVRPPSGSSPSAWSRDHDDEKKGDGGEGDGDQEDSGPTIVIEPGPAPRGGGKISSAVYALTAAGGARKLVELPKRAAVDMVAVGDDVYVATDQEGKVYRCNTGSSDYSVYLNFKAAQVLSLLADDKGLAFLGTGSPAVLGKVKSGIADKASYTSRVMDAKFPAQWGAIEIEADGPLQVSTRSGNIKDPGRGWSGWQSAGMGNPAAIKSPDARYLQVRIEWPPLSHAALTSLAVPYQIYNQPHYVDLVAVDGVEQDGNGDAKARSASSQSKSGNDSNLKPHETERKLMWKVTNDDKDSLEYLLYFQPAGTDAWIRIKTPEPVTKTKFTWDTGSMPDGWYRIKVEATDAPANPPNQALTAGAVSERFLVDNRPPEIKGLRVIGNKASGKVEDGVSAVSGIQYSIDGGHWVQVGARDGILDSTSESFEFDIPSDVEAGAHIIAVRAWDRANNLDSEQEQFKK